MNSIVALVAAGLLLWMQPDQASLINRVSALDDAAARRVVAAELAATRGALDRLIQQLDASVHSDRQRPEQRRVQYDEEALAHGLRLGSLLADATGDRTYARRFEARKQRLEGTRLLNDRRYQDALTPLGAALEEAQALGDRWLQAITRVNVAYGQLELGHGQEALAESERAAEVARSLDDRARGLTLYNLASVHLHRGNYAESIGYSRQVLAISRAAGLRLWEGNSLINIGAAAQALDDLETSHHAFEEALRVLEQTRDRLGTGRALYNLGALAARQERYEQATDYLERALPIIRTVDIRHSHAIEPEPERYQNPVEIAALEMLIDAYSHTGNAAQAAARMIELRQARQRVKPAGHSHKPPHW